MCVDVDIFEASKERYQNIVIKELVDSLPYDYLLRDKTKGYKGLSKRELGFLHARASNCNKRAKKASVRGRCIAYHLGMKWLAADRRCYYCNKELHLRRGPGRNPKNYASIDHFIPFSLGGTGWHENLVWSCEYCNRSKGLKLPSEFKSGEGMVPRFV